MAACLRWTVAVVCMVVPTIPASAQGQPPIKTAVQRGVHYLKSRQTQDGYWILGEPDSAQPQRAPGQREIGVTALAGMALLACGAHPGDPEMTKASDVIRGAVPTLQETYSISLALLYLDRLGHPGDEPSIQLLTKRLVAGQGQRGGWGYRCRNQVQDHQRTDSDKKKQLGNDPLIAEEVDTEEDNSNTQFATLALWVGRRHGLGVDEAIGRVITHFRKTQNRDGGWDYKLLPSRARIQVGARSSPSMTCAGLLGLAIALGSDHPSSSRGSRSREEGVADPGIQAGLRFLGASLEPVLSQTQTPSLAGAGGSAAVPVTYYLWSVERVAMIYDLRTIGGQDWYRLGARFFLANQQRDGSWQLKYRGVADSCFALLFLQRSNLAEDLSARWKGKIKDPGETVLRSRSIDREELKSKSDSQREIAGPPRKEPDAKWKDPAPAPLFEESNKADSEAADRAAKLLRAPTERQDAILAELRDSRGPANTEALAKAIPQLTGSVRQKARDALAERLARMSADTVRSKLREDDAEIRRAAALACAMKQDASLAGALIDLLADPLPSVNRAAYVALKKLTGQDFGSAVESIPKWKAWLRNQAISSGKK